MNNQQNAPGNQCALLLFGSAARGETTKDSDVDLLVISRVGVSPQTAGLFGLIGRFDLSISSATPINAMFRSESELQCLLDSRSLFALHFQLEGRVLVDESGLLVRLLSVPVRVDFGTAEMKLRAETAVLFAEDVNPFCPAVHAVARHLARTAAFLNCARIGKPTFSTVRAAEALNDQGVRDLLRRNAAPTRSRFEALRDYVIGYCGRPNVVGAPLSMLLNRSRFASQIIQRRTMLQYDPPVEDLVRARHRRLVCPVAA